MFVVFALALVYPTPCRGASTLSCSGSPSGRLFELELELGKPAAECFVVFVLALVLPLTLSWSFNLILFWKVLWETLWKTLWKTLWSEGLGTGSYIQPSSSHESQSKAGISAFNFRRFKRPLAPEKRDEVKGRSAPWTWGWELGAGKGEPAVECLLCLRLL